MASEWKPLKDGEYIMQGMGNFTFTVEVSDGGESLASWNNENGNFFNDGTPRYIDEIGIGDYRLCRRVEVDAPAVTVPDEVAQTIRGALEIRHTQLMAIAKSVEPAWVNAEWYAGVVANAQRAIKIAEKIDVALAWLEGRRVDD